MPRGTKRCAVCLAEAREVLTGLEGFRVGDFYDVYECEGCHSSFCDPQDAGPELYQAIYRHCEGLAGYCRYYAYSRAVKQERFPLEFLAEREDCYWFVADYLKKHVDRRRARLLEVGSGLGYLTYSLDRAGYDVRGVELSSIAVADATREFGDLYRCRDASTLAQEGERFEVILLTQVIEHVADPTSFIRNLAALLAPRGVILVATPNKRFAPNRASRWLTDLPPVHLWWFTKDAFRKMAEGAGYSVSFHSFREWHATRFPRALLKPAEPFTLQPRMNRDGTPAFSEKTSLKAGSLIQKGKSLLRYARYRKTVDVDDGAIIGAVFARSCSATP